jgi:hypothetical protein
MWVRTGFIWSETKSKFRKQETGKQEAGSRKQEDIAVAAWVRDS